MPYKDKEKQKKYQQDHYQRNRDLVYARSQQRRNDARDSAMQSLYAKYIIDMRLWKLWFNDKTKETAYILSAEEAFELLKQGCFYCGDFATTLDRLDSDMTHTLENCVGCCDFCNSSKQATDPRTFILRVVYRRRFIYCEDDDIWHDNKHKTRWDMYKIRSSIKKCPFEITKDQFNKMIEEQCHYCKRYPSINKYFGIDKIFPDDGYTLDNCVTACTSCNVAKWNATIEEFTLRDERITERYLEGYFNHLPNVEKNIFHNKMK